MSGKEKEITGQQLEFRPLQIALFGIVERLVAFRGSL